MKAIYVELSQRICGECQDLELVIQRALRAWSQAQKLADEDGAYLDSVALNLHCFYSGIERLFELIARHIDGTYQTGETWHRDLLDQMVREVEGLRPAVIEQNTAFSLDEFRRFRHLVRNVYTVNFEPDKMIGLMSALPELWKKLHAEMMAFADFVEELAKATEDK